MQSTLEAGVGNDARRLALAVLISAALHASLIFAVAVRRPSAASDAEPIFARLQALPAMAALDLEPHPLAEPERRPAARRAPDGAQPRPKAVVAPVEPDSIPQAVPPPAEALPAVEMPLIVDTAWYPAAQLDVFPSALAPVRPAYPRAAAEADVAGAVTLLLLIDETGRVHDSAVVDAQPENTFEEAVLEAFRAARFTPGQRDGRNVRSRVLIKVVFNPAQAAP